MRDPKKRIKVAPIETSLLYLVGVILPIILLVLAILSSTLRAERSDPKGTNPSHQGWTEVSKSE